MVVADIIHAAAYEVQWVVQFMRQLSRNLTQGVFTLLVGGLMVSTVPTFSGKGLSTIRRDLVLPLMLFIGFTAVMLFTFPWVTLIAISVAYYLAVPLSWLSHRRHARG